MRDYFALQAEQETVLGLSTLGLAYLGDAVFELMVRSMLCLEGKSTAKRLHRAAVKYVSAPAQAGMAGKLLPLLSEEERDVFRRGRNTSPHTIPQAASREEYQTATALEALLGWLYLQGRRERLNELFAVMIGGELDGAGCHLPCRCAAGDTSRCGGGANRQDLSAGEQGCASGRSGE